MAFSVPVRLKEHHQDATNKGTLFGAAQKIIAAAAIGDLVVVELGYGLGSSPTITVTDSQSNNYQQAERADKLTGNTPHSAIYYAVLTTGLVSGTDYISVSFGTNVNYPCGLIYKSTPTAGTTVTLDQHNAATGVSTSPSSGNVTTTGTDEILFGAVCTGLPQSLTAGGSWTLLDSTSFTSSKRLDGEYRIESGTGTFTADGSITSADWADCVAAFKASVAFIPQIQIVLN